MATVRWRRIEMTGPKQRTRVALYARVSTHNGQDTEVQLQPLREMAEQRGWKVVGEFIDEGISGSKEERPELSKLMALAHRGRLDAVAVWKFDRFARSVSHLVSALEEFKAQRIDFVSLTEAVDSSTPAGKLLFVVVAAMAAFELDLARERITAGIARAKSQGTHCGRPRKELDLRAARELLRSGYSVRQAADMLAIPRTTLRRKLAEEGGGPKASKDEVPKNGEKDRAATTGQ